MSHYHQVLLVAGGTGVAAAAAVAAALLDEAEEERGDTAAAAAAAAAAATAAPAARGLRASASIAVRDRVARPAAAGALAAGRGAALVWALRGPADPEAWLPGLLPRLRASRLFGPDRVEVYVTGGGGGTEGTADAPEDEEDDGYSGDSRDGLAVAPSPHAPPGVVPPAQPRSGRPDIDAAVAAAVARAQAAGHPPSRVAVVACGPPPLAAAVTRAAAAHGAHAHVDTAASTGLAGPLLPPKHAAASATGGVQDGVVGGTPHPRTSAFDRTAAALNRAVLPARKAAEAVGGWLFMLPLLPLVVLLFLLLRVAQFVRGHAARGAQGGAGEAGVSSLSHLRSLLTTPLAANGVSAGAHPDDGGASPNTDVEAPLPPLPPKPVSPAKILITGVPSRLMGVGDA